MTSMTTQVFFIFGKAENALIVPAEVLTAARRSKQRRRQGLSHRGDHRQRPEQRVVCVGLQSRTQAEVVDGLRRRRTDRSESTRRRSQPDGQSGEWSSAAPVISRASTEGHSYERDYPRTAYVEKHSPTAIPPCAPSTACRCEIRRGELVGIMGPSGSGESTLMNVSASRSPERGQFSGARPRSGES